MAISELRNMLLRLAEEVKRVNPANIVEGCAKAVEGFTDDRDDRKWVPGSLYDTLRREAAASVRNRFNSPDATDWAELHQLANEALGLLESTDDKAASSTAAPEFFAVLRLGDPNAGSGVRTEVIGFDDEGEAEAYLESRLAEVGRTHEVYFEDVIPFRIFTSAEFAASFKAANDAVTPGDVFRRMRGLADASPELAAPLEALCRAAPGGVAKLSTQRFYTFDVDGDDAVFTDDMRSRIESELGVKFIETVYPGYEGETALAFPASLARAVKDYLDFTSFEKSISAPPSAAPHAMNEQVNSSASAMRVVTQGGLMPITQFNGVEIHSMIEGEESPELVQACDDPDASIVAFSVFLHYRSGGVECVSDFAFDATMPGDSRRAAAAAVDCAISLTDMLVVSDPVPGEKFTGDHYADTVDELQAEVEARQPRSPSVRDVG